MTGGSRPDGAPRFDVLRDRNYRLFFAGYTTSVVGSAMVPVALTFAVLDQGGSAADVGYVLAAQTVPLVALLLAGGVIADRLSRQTVMVSADLVRSASELLLAALLVTGSPPLWVFMVLAGVIGGGQAFFNPALTGLVPLIVGRSQLQQANALTGLATSAGQIVGPATAGLIVAASGAGWAIAIDGATYAVSALCLARLRLPARLLRDGESFSTSSARAGESSVRAPGCVIVVQFGLFHMFVYAPFIVLGAVVAKTELGGAAAWGLILTAQGAGSILGGIAILRARPRRPLVVATLGTFAFAGPIALLALRASVVWIAGAAAISGLGIAVFGVLWDTTLQQHIPGPVLSRVSAYDWLGSIALSPLGFVLAGSFANAIGVSGALWFAAGWTVLGSAVVLGVPSVRRLQALPAIPSL